MIKVTLYPKNRVVIELPNEEDVSALCSVINDEQAFDEKQAGICYYLVDAIEKNPIKPEAEKYAKLFEIENRTAEEMLETAECYFNAKTGDLYLINWPQNRPDMTDGNWVKISTEAYYALMGAIYNNHR